VDSVTRIEVAVKSSPYTISVGPDLLNGLPALLTAPRHAKKAAVVTSEPIMNLYGSRVLAGIEALGLDVHPVIVPDGEQAKNPDTLLSCYRSFSRIPLGRRDIVIALGGGVIGDLAGFAAATWTRGVPVVQLATTLVAQVDSAIGGKTGINLPEGKNLVGAFHQPLAVINDINCLATLPERELRAGLAEVVKCGFISDVAILDAIESTPEAAVKGEPELLTELVRRSAEVKAVVVGDDEFEAGRREILNYGHTVGHAIETLSGYETYRHGEAVAIGMVFAARLGERLGVSVDGLASRTVDLLTRLGLPTGGVDLDTSAVWDVISRDKKARDGVRFVICPHPGEAITVDQPDRALINEVIASLR
jgi:3-dehydroquinate synthase